MPRRHLSITLLFLAGLGLFARDTAAAEPRGDDSGGPAATTDVLPPAPRDSQQQLAAARKAIEQERYVDALGVLQALVTGKADDGIGKIEDGFIPAADQDDARTSLRREAWRQLGSLPPKGRELYESKYGPDAQLLLQRAIEDHDLVGLGKLSDNWFHTKAGRTATLLLAYDCLDRGQPAEALGRLRRIARSPVVVAECEPGFSLLVTACALAAGDRENARTALQQLQSRCPDATVRVGGRAFGLAREGTEAWQTLEKLFTRPQAVAKETDAWTMFRGNTARNGPSRWAGQQAGKRGQSPRTNGDGPLFPGEVQWDVPYAAADSQDAGTLRNYASTTQGGSPPAMPALHPLVVGDLALLRTPRLLLAVDFRSGRQAWEFPWETTSEESGPAQNLNNPFLIVNRADPGEQLRQRVGEDAAYGQLASDGRLVFLLDKLDWAGTRATRLRNGLVVRLPGQMGSGRPAPNRLVALDSKKEGRLAWGVGGTNGEDEPALADAFFLGPPLVDGRSLYVLAEIKGEIVLFALQALTGRLEWSQTIARPREVVARDPLRRLAGATPSLADGVLVCPTTAGAVVAVELATRSLLWGHAYPRPQRPVETCCVDATATIADGRVLVTPPDSDMLHCLDLFTGRELWSCSRGDTRYVACVHEGKVVLVGRNEVSALRLADRKPAWSRPSLALPGDGSPSGRGLYCGRFYYLPTTLRQLLQIDLDGGRIVAEVRTDGQLGNLVAARGRLIAQGIQGVRQFAP